MDTDLTDIYQMKIFKTAILGVAQLLNHEYADSSIGQCLNETPNSMCQPLIDSHHLSAKSESAKSTHLEATEV